MEKVIENRVKSSNLIFTTGDKDNTVIAIQYTD